MTRAFITALYLRELRLVRARKLELLLPLAFFAAVVMLFPLGVGPEPERLREIAPGIVWACALLAALLSVQSLYSADAADGTLEQLLLAGGSGLPVAWAKAAAHWSVTGAPLLVAAPLAALMLGLPGASARTLALGLLLGTPILSLLGNVGAALTVGLRGGALLLPLLVLPLAMPVLVLGSGAVLAVQGGQVASPHQALLGALLIATLLTAPPAAAAALRIAAQ